MTHETAECLEDEDTVVVLLFGRAAGKATAELVHRLRATHSALSRTKPFEVVYIGTSDPKLEHERFVQRDASNWWSLPWSACASLGARAERRFRVQSEPTALVTQYKLGGAGKRGLVQVLNSDAAADILSDPKGDGFPWPTQSVDKLMGTPSWTTACMHLTPHVSPVYLAGPSTS